MPVIVLDSYDCAGKTTIARRLSKLYNIPIYLDGATQRPEFRSSHEHKLWAQSAYNHLARILCSNVEVNMIIDRWIFTEYCYAPVLRGYDIRDYYSKIENQLAETGKLIWVYPFVSDIDELKRRYVKKRENFLTFKNLLKVKDRYEELYSTTKFPGLAVNTSDKDRSVTDIANSICKFIHKFVKVKSCQKK